MPLHKLGQFFVSAVLLSAVFSFLSTLNNGLAANLSSQVIVPYTNYLPEISNILINSGNPINLTSNTTTPITISASITDQNGCSDLDLSSSYLLLYRSGYTSTTCATSQNYRACYGAQITETSSCISTTQINVTGTIPFWYFADATDASSSFSGQDWRATLMAYDNSGISQPVPFSISYSLAFTANGYVYSLGGYNAGYTSTVLYAPINNDGTLSDWATTTPLSYAVSDNPSFSYDNYVYSIGGDASGSATSTVLYAPTNSSGTIGAWTNTTPLPQGRLYHSVFSYGGRVYSVGGYNSSWNLTSDVFYAPINSSGTIDAWATTTPLPNISAYGSSFAFNGRAYLVGGYADYYRTSTVLYAPINSSGTIGAWTTTTPLPSAIYHHSSFVYNDRVYVAGGRVDSNDSTSTVFYAQINGDGTIGPWNTTAYLPNKLHNHSAFSYGNYAYVVGGTTSTVLSARINPDGSISYWGQGRNAVSSPSGVELNTLLSINPATSTINYGTVNPNTNTGSTNQELQIFNTGNATYTLTISGTALTNGGNSISTSSQHFASDTFTYGGGEQQLASTPVSLSGVNVSPGGWSAWTNTTPLPSSVEGYKPLAHNNRIYVIGGWVSGVATSTVLYAPINSSGTIGAWTNTTPLPSAFYSHPSLVYNDRVYVVGGSSPSVATSTVLYAPINSSGTIGAWTNTTPLPSAITRHSSFTHNNRVYVVGGLAGSSETSTVLYAPINSSGTIGAWTTTTPLPSASRDHSAFIYNDRIYVIGGLRYILASPHATSSVFYADISGDGSVGSWNYATSLPIKKYGHSSFIYNNRFYVLGGNDSINSQNIILISQINSEGVLSEWKNSGFLPPFPSDIPLVSYKNSVYVAGGFFGGITSTVFYANLDGNSTHWGLSVPDGSAIGTYSGVNTITAVFSP
jgi:N-acetylneuraminic acid mutarotase